MSEKTWDCRGGNSVRVGKVVEGQAVDKCPVPLAGQSEIFWMTPTAHASEQNRASGIEPFYESRENLEGSRFGGGLARDVWERRQLREKHWRVAPRTAKGKPT